MAKEMRKVRTGTVVRTRMYKTAVVEAVWKQRHRLYRKQMRRVARFIVHDPLSQCQLGDLVRIQEVRPVSKTKRWRLLDILEQRQVAEVRPIELEADAEVVVTAELVADQEDLEADGLAGGESPEDDLDPAFDELMTGAEDKEEAPEPEDGDGGK